MSIYGKSGHSRIRRVPQRASYEREDIDAILEAGLVCHVAFVDQGRPLAIPTVYARDGDRLLIHGATKSRLIEVVASGAPVGVSVTLLDGLVLARSAFHHSMNYRSVVVLGRGVLLEDEAERLAALRRISDHVVPGRWSDVRGPSEKELTATAVCAIIVEEASAKVRVGPPVDEEEDMELPCWAGVLPIVTSVGPPEPDPQLPAGVPLPGYLVDAAR